MQTIGSRQSAGLMFQKVTSDRVFLYIYLYSHTKIFDPLVGPFAQFLGLNREIPAHAFFIAQATWYWLMLRSGDLRSASTRAASPACTAWCKVLGA